MKQLIISFLFSAAAYGHLSAQIGSDSKTLTSARQLLDKKQDCDGALKALQQTTEAGKATATYLLLAGRTYDCLGNVPEAIDYYLRYLSTGVTADSVSRRLATLQKAQSTARLPETMPNGEKVPVTGINARFIRHRRMVLGLASDIYVAGNDAPFGLGGSLFTSYELRFAHNRILLEPAANLGMMTFAHKPWFASALNTTPGDITDVFNSVSADFELVTSVVITNTEKLAVVAGPLIGVAVYKLQEIETNKAAPVYSSSVFSTPVTGIRLGLFLGKRVAFYGTYLHAFPTTFTNYGKGFTSITPTDVSSVRIGVGIRNLFW